MLTVIEILTHPLSLVYLALSVVTAVRWRRNWSSFWDDRVTHDDLSLALSVVVFLLVPVKVLVHEVGHAIAVRLQGGVVLQLVWTGFSGYVSHDGIRTELGDWWVTVSGTLASLILIAAALAAIRFVKRPIGRHLLYLFAMLAVLHTLVFYPVLSFVDPGLTGGDWKRIYDFSLAPYAQVAVLVQALLLLGFWRLDRSDWAARQKLDAPVPGGARSSRGFKIVIRDGVPRVTKGTVSAAFLSDLQSICDEGGIRSAKIRGTAAPDGTRLSFSRLPEDHQQRIRNIYLMRVS